jgi:hypothetical protein
MSNPLEIYAFVSNSYWFEHLSAEFPHAITVGDYYRMIQFVHWEESERLARASENGIIHRKFNTTKTIQQMEKQVFEYFVVYGDSNDVHTVVEHFNNVTEV